MIDDLGFPVEDYPNPQGLPRFIPPAHAPGGLDERDEVCEGLDSIKLESWNDKQHDCREYGAKMPDGTLFDLGNKESIAMQRVRAYANDLQRGERMPSEAWDGGLGGVIGDGL